MYPLAYGAAFHGRRQRRLIMGKRVVVIGSSNTDMVVQVDRLPRQGETVLGGEFSTAAGGKGANQAVAAARAGGDVALIARIGNDLFGQQAVASLVQDKVDVDYVVRDSDRNSGVALIVVDHAGENAIAVAPGANGALSPHDIQAAGAIIAAADLVVMQLEVPLETIQAAVALAAEAGVRVLLNPAPASPLDGKLLRHVAILTPNQFEAELLTGVRIRDAADAQAAAEVLAGQGVAAVLITLGARGVYVFGEGVSELSPAYEVEAVDSTAAGDVFNGALAVALAEAMPLARAVSFAAAAGALAATKLGAQPSAPTRAEIDALFQQRSPT